MSGVGRGRGDFGRSGSPEHEGRRSPDRQLPFLEMVGGDEQRRNEIGGLDGMAEVFEESEVGNVGIATSSVGDLAGQAPVPGISDVPSNEPDFSETDKDIEDNDDEMEHEEEEEGNGDPSDTNPKRRKRSKPPPKKKMDDNFIENYRDRRQCATKSGASLKRQVKRYQLKTGAQVFFKAYFAFNGGGGAMFQAGEDFKTPDESQGTTDTDWKNTVGQTIADAITTVLRNKRPSTKPQQPSTPTVFSPKKTVPEALEKNKCGICKNHDVVEMLLKYPSAWIGCQYPSCERWFHLDCIGFPGVTSDAVVKKMPSYFCSDHRQYGRMLGGNLPLGYSEGPSSSSSSMVAQDPTPPPTRRGRDGRKR